MDHPQQPPDEALRQRFRDLTEQFHHVNQAWQEAYDQQDIGRQMDLIDREHVILVQLHKLIADFQQALQERRASYGQPPERTPC